MSLLSATSTDHALEIREPAGVWRPALDELYGRARSLAYRGRHEEALTAAEEALVAARGNMHGVEFRVVTNTRTATWHGAAPEMLLR